VSKRTKKRKTLYERSRPSNLKKLERQGKLQERQKIIEKIVIGKKYMTSDKKYKKCKNGECGFH
jgi:replication-associated recombination protein RarA